MNTDSTDVSVSRLAQPVETHKEPQLISNVKRNLDSNQAIDFSRTTGPDTFRRIRRLMTPDGMQDVICLIDTEGEFSLPDIDYIPHYDMPEQGLCFGAVQSTSAGEGVLAPLFSYRTQAQLSFAQKFQSHCLVKLYCMTPLPMSVSYWVYRTLQGNDTNHLSQIGFTWKPTLQNVVYVLMPYAALPLVSDYDMEPSQIFGYLGIKPLSGYVHEDGTQSSADVSAYFAPYSAKQAIPRVLTPPTTHADSVSTVSNGSFKFNLKSPSRLAINGMESKGLHFQDLKDALIDGRPVRSESWYSPGAHTLSTSSDVVSFVNILALSRKPGSNVTIEQLTDPRQINGFEEYLDTEMYYLPTLKSLQLEFNSEINEPIQRLLDAARKKDIEMVFSSRVLQQNPDKILVSLFIDGVVYATFIGTTAKQAKRRLAVLVTEILDVVEGVEEMYEYKFNPESKIPDSYYGAQGDKSAREISHWYKVSTLTMSNADASSVQTQSIDLTALSEMSPQNTALFEYRRHYLKHRYPFVKVQAVKTPFTNAIIRIVQGIHTSTDQINQLPYREWNLAEDQEFEFYWDNSNPATPDLVLNFSFYLMGYSIAPSALTLNFFINSSNLDYYHYRPIDFENVVVNAIEQIGGDELPTDQDKPETSILHEATAVTAKPTQNLAIGGMPSERKYHYMFKLNFTLTGGFYFDLCHTNFPAYEFPTARRYARWRGTPYLKFTVDTKYDLTGILYIMQVDPFITPTKANMEQLLRFYPSTKLVIKNGSVEMPINFRQSTPRQAVWYNPTTSPQLGRIVVFNTSYLIGLPAGNDFVSMLVEGDLSEVTYDIPEFGYPNITIPSPRVDAIV